MRRLTNSAALALLLLSLSVAGPHAVAAPAEPAAPQGGPISTLPAGVRFLHTATIANIAGATTAPNIAAADNDPTALLFATHNWNPGGEGGQYNDRNVGVEYSVDLVGFGPAGLSGRWLLFNEDLAAFDPGLAYNLMLTPAGDRAFTHTTSVENTLNNVTSLDNAWLNGQPNRIPFVLHNLTPGGVASGAPLTGTVGVTYDSSHWIILTEDSSNLPLGASFNILVGVPGINVFTHTATIDVTFKNYTYLDHPWANGHPNAVILVTQNPHVNPNGAIMYNNHPVGVYYDTGYEHWAIYNDDLADMPIGAGFSVLIDEAHLYLPLVQR